MPPLATRPHGLIRSRSTHRAFLVMLVALLTVSAAMACSAEQARPAASGSGSGAGPFPVTIDHMFGSTEIPERPDRVLSLGYQDHDAIFALGVTPIALRYWFGDESDVIFPWAEDEAGDADPEILNMTFGELNYEKIAALQPDLILGTSLGFRVPAEIDELAGDSFYVEISSERVDLLDTDLLVWDQLQYLPGGRTTVEANRLVQQLEATQQDRAIFLEGDLENAFGFNTVLSLPFLLDGVVPMIEAA